MSDPAQGDSTADRFFSRRTPLPATDSGTLAVTVGLPWTLGVTLRPSVTIDGVSRSHTAGRNTYAVAPGRHTVACAVSTGGAEFGVATHDVDVEAGRTAEVFYAAPMSARDPGRIGSIPQEPYRGGLSRTAIGVVIGILGLFMVWVVIAGFLVLGR
jgi:hypothetical protein